MARNSNGNRILAALGGDELAAVQASSTRVSMERRATIWKPGETIQAVYFPATCVTSVVALDEDEMGIEVGTIGNEGMAGLPAFLGADTSPQHAFVQVTGDAYRIELEEFKRLTAEGLQLRQLLQLYTQAFVNQVSQSVACNRLHDPGKRLARWLLMTHDRVRGDVFDLTHEFLGQMLGVRRATVTEAAGVLQDAGIIQYNRGAIQVLDRPGLEAASCVCYRIVRDEFDRLLGAPVG